MNVTFVVVVLLAGRHPIARRLARKSPLAMDTQYPDKTTGGSGVGVGMIIVDWMLERTNSESGSRGVI